MPWQVKMPDLKNDPAYLEPRVSDAESKIKKRTTGVLYVEDFNPVGDGVTDDQTAIANAVADAYNKGMALMWSDKTYLTTANIPYFHSVKHLGEGIIKRSTDLFYISPKGDQRNKIYTAATGGSNTYDGLSSGQPIVQLGVAFAALENYGPVLTGYWEIVMTSGTYARRASLKDGLLSVNPIEITGADVGGHPKVPTTILSEGTGISALGVQISGGSRIKVKDVKVVGFNGSTSSCGLSAANHAEIITSNVHTDQSYYGVSGIKASIVVPDGIHENNGKLPDGSGTGAAIRSLQLNKHTIGIQNAGARTSTAIFRNNKTGVFAQESSTGHVDWCTFEDNEDALILHVNARINGDGCSFKRNIRDGRVYSGSNVYLTSNNVFGTGVDESGSKFIELGGYVLTDQLIEGISTSNSLVSRIFETKYLNQSISTTSLTIFHTVNLLAPLWRSTPTSSYKGKKLFFKFYGVLNGTANTKNITVRLGNTVVSASYTATESGAFQADGEIYFFEKERQFMFLNTERHLGSSVRKSRSIATNTMSTNIALTFEASVADVADSIVIDLIEIGWAG